MGFHPGANEDPLKALNQIMGPAALSNGQPLPFRPFKIETNGDKMSKPPVSPGTEAAIAASAGGDQARGPHQPESSAAQEHVQVQPAAAISTAPQGSSAESAADQGETSEAPRQAGPSMQLPERVDVIVGTLRGVLDLKRLRILCNGGRLAF
jgi:hypothetical protein